MLHDQRSAHQPEGPHVELRTGTPYANLSAHQRMFAEAMGGYFGIAWNQVVPTAGATGAIEAVRNHVLKLSASRRPKVLTVSPGYWRARESFQGLGFEISDVHTEQHGFTVDEAGFAGRAVEEAAELVYLSLPNNPTGAVFDPAKLIEGIPEATTIMLDLTLPSRLLDVRALVGALSDGFKGRKNLFLVGSSSKSHGTAEYRIGWAVCTHAADAQELKQENRSGVATFSIKEGMRCLGEPPSAFELIDRSFSLLRAGARAGRFQLIEPARRTETAYVLIKSRVGGLRQSLAERRISVMWGTEFGLSDDYIRLETLEPSSIEVLIATLNGHQAGTPEAGEYEAVG